MQSVVDQVLMTGRDQDVRTFGCHPVRGVWPALGRVSPDVTSVVNVWAVNTRIFRIQQ